MKSTVFTQYHERLGAKMAEFAGYNMPIEYTGIKDEHIAVRENVGVFDVSHMGEFWVKGPKAEAFVQRLTSNNVLDLTDGKVQYSCFPNGKGGIVDDLLVYRINSETYLLVVNAANIKKDWDWCVTQAKEFGIEVGKELYNASDEICQLAVQGPNALKLVQKITDCNIVEMPYYTFKKCRVAGVKDAILSITGYTGSGGCEIYVSNQDGKKLWETLIGAGKEFNLKPIGLGARDTLRLEAGFCLYGNDINDSTSAIEAGLGWITKFTPGNDFIDKEMWENQKSEGVSMGLKGFVLEDRGIPRQHYKVLNEDDIEIGEVTSGTMSPILNKGIGLAYIKSDYWKIGSEIYIQVRNKKLKAKVTKPPFVAL